MWCLSNILTKLHLMNKKKKDIDYYFKNNITHEKPTTPKPKGPIVIDKRYKVCRNCTYITKQLGSNANDIYPYYCKKHNFKEYPIDSFGCNDWEESEKAKKEKECGFRRIK